MQRKPVFTNVLQVAVVVRNLDEAVRRYAEEYGIGPWKIYNNLKQHKNMMIRDKPASYSMRIALCDIGTVNWELVEPLDEETIYAEFLRKHGEGVQHVAFATDHVPTAIEHGRRRSPAGIGVLQAGTFERNRPGVRYTYLDTEKDLGVVAELFEFPPGWELPTPDAIYPPPEASA